MSHHYFPFRATYFLPGKTTFLNGIFMAFKVWFLKIQPRHSKKHNSNHFFQFYLWLIFCVSVLIAKTKDYIPWKPTKLEPHLRFKPPLLKFVNKAGFSWRISWSLSWILSRNLSWNLKLVFKLVSVIVLKLLLKKFRLVLRLFLKHFWKHFLELSCSLF